MQVRFCLLLGLLLLTCTHAEQDSTDLAIKAPVAERQLQNAIALRQAGITSQHTAVLHKGTLWSPACPVLLVVLSVRGRACLQKQARCYQEGPTACCSPAASRGGGETASPHECDSTFIQYDLAAVRPPVHLWRAVHWRVQCCCTEGAGKGI